MERQTRDAKVLVVDDEKLKRVSLSAELEAAGYAVVACPTADEAMEDLKNADFDVIVTDLKMPGMDGLTFLKKVKRLRPETVVIVITAYGTVDSAVEAMQAGAHDYIAKPFSDEELVFKIDKVLAYDRSVRENTELRKRLGEKVGFDGIVGQSSAMRRVLDMVERVLESDCSLLLSGETGTGKELVATAIHYNSHRRDGPFVPVSCAALTSSLLESELFGHERGAFTGALKQKRGRFERAGGGTLLLDEVDDIPLDVQVKLLRVLESGSFERVGGEGPLTPDVRILAATKRDLEQLVEEGKFREDLYYRLNVVHVSLPPLRERADDIPRMAQHFLAEFRGDKRIKGISGAAMECLICYHWPGNVRELRNAMERAVALCRTAEIQTEDLPEALRRRPREGSIVALSLDGQESVSMSAVIGQTERELIRWAMGRASGNQIHAAEILGVPRTTLQSKLAKLNTAKGVADASASGAETSAGSVDAD
ncbi:MAG: sigma-54-dependent transcriptional regulator [Planctomycetota bacterium]